MHEGHPRGSGAIGESLGHHRVQSFEKLAVIGRQDADLDPAIADGDLSTNQVQAILGQMFEIERHCALPPRYMVVVSSEMKEITHRTVPTVLFFKQKTWYGRIANIRDFVKNG